MTMRNIRRLTVYLSLLFCLLAFGCSQEKPIKMAFNIPMSGDLSDYGNSIHNGVEMALDELDSSGKKPIAVDFQDNKGLPKDAVTIFQQQKIGGFDLYVSGVSPQTMSIIDNVSATGVPHFVYVFGAFVCDQYKNTCRTWLNFREEGENYIRFIKQRSPKKVAITYVDLAATAEEFDKIVIPYLKQNNIDYTVQVYPIEQADLRDVVEKLRAYNPDLLLVNGFKFQMVSLVKNLRALNLVKGDNVMCSMDLLDARPELSDDLVENLVLSAPGFLVNPTPKLVAWEKTYNAKYHHAPLYTDLYAYDMMKIVADAARTDTGRLDLRKAILHTSIPGITSDTLRFNANGDLHLDLPLSTYKNGKLTVYERKSY